MENTEIKTIENVLATFFSLCDGVVGAEATYQALLAAELERAYPGCVRREAKYARTGRGGIDITVNDANGNIQHAFELKGGAYSNRNALSDVFSDSGYCTDMKKLSKVDVQPNNRWLIAVDATELGCSLNYHRQIRAAETANLLGVGFAYYGHGDDSFMLASVDGKIRYPEIDPRNKCIGMEVNPSNLIPGRSIERYLNSFNDTNIREADLVTSVYRSLRSSGYSAKQISLETYYGFAPGDMHQRPDLCLFDNGIQGHFNLYPNGDTSKSNDALKLSNLRLMIEVKGGSALLRKTDAALKKIYLGDIDKLGRWRSIVNDTANRLGIDEPDVRYLCMGIDMREASMDDYYVDNLRQYASTLGVHFMYTHISQTINEEAKYASA